MLEIDWNTSTILSAFSLVSLAVGIFIAAGCTKPVAVKIAKTIIHAPVIHVGI